MVPGGYGRFDWTEIDVTGSDWTADLPPDRYTEWTSELEIYVRMRDGVHLSTDVMLPKGATGKLPTLLVRTPYDKAQGPTVLEQVFLKQGYAVVLQSERGRYFSEGRYDNYLEGASTDGLDTVEWIVDQPWSNDKVGTIGCSSTAEHQWPMAASNHPAHAAMAPVASGSAIGNIPGNDTRGAFYRGGIPLSGFWSAWYSDQVPVERLVLPPNTTQEQRLRLRKSYSLQPKALVGPGGSADPTKLMHLPGKDALRVLGGSMNAFDDYLTWGPADPRWDAVEHIGAEARPRVPALHMNTWHDIAIGETVRLFSYLQELGTPHQYLIVGPGPHCSMMRELISHLTVAETRKLSAGGLPDFSKLPDFEMSDLKFGDLEIGDARYRGVDHGYTKLFLKWFDHWLGGQRNEVLDMPRVQIYVMGRGWISGDQWPLRETRTTTYYLDGDPESRRRHENGILSTSPPSSHSADSFVYDPAVPVPSLGGGCCEFANALDQRSVEMRRDVLVYSTPVLTEPITIAGPVEVVLYVSSSAKDTDFIVKLVDVYPEGKAINLNDDGFRVRYREGFDRSVPMEQDGVYKITLRNMVTANRFAAGHRIRLDVTSSCFPLYERNLNTGGNNYDETTWEVAENTVHRSAQHPSRVVMMALPD